jgi:hypothetical protein
MSVMVETKIIRRPEWHLPPTVADRLRKMALDNFNGSVELLIRNGRIRGLHVTENLDVPPHEIP